MRHGMKWYRFVLLSAVLLLGLSPLQAVPIVALDNAPEFEQITSIDGLSHDTVYSIAQDKSGFLWFGSEDGLNKFDGYKISVYREGNTNTSLGNANCAVVYIDENNKIWVASWGGGIQVLDQSAGTVSSYVHQADDPKSISDNSVHSIYKAKDGIMWFGTYTQGLNKFDSTNETFTSYVHDDNANSIADNRVWWITEDTDGTLLLGTNKGLDRFDPKTETFTHITAISNRVRTIYWDKAGVLWLGTQKGLCSYDPLGNVSHCYTHSDTLSSKDVITSIIEDSMGNFWVGSSDGLNLFDKTTGIFTRFAHDEMDAYSIGNNDIRVIFEDTSGNLWVGTRGGGVSKFNIKPRKFESYQHAGSSWVTLSDVNVLSIMEDHNGVYWIGTNNGGLNRVDPIHKTQSNLLSDITKEENRNLSAIVEDDDQVWIGSLGGLNRFNTLTNEIFTYKKSESEGSLSHNTVLSILKTQDGSIWVGTLIGLNKYDESNDRFTTYFSDSKNPETLSSDTINTLIQDHIGNLWIGTANGLNKFDPLTSKFTRFTYNANANSISDNIIHSLFEDADHILWIGTQYGLNRYDFENGQFTLYTTENGLPNNNIHAIQQDTSGNLWITTNKGLSKFDPNQIVFTNYDLMDGLQGNNYNNASTITKAGVLMFGGPNGVDLVDPDKVSKNTFLPPLVITGFKVMNQEFDIQKALTEQGKLALTYQQKTISVEFSSLDYTLPTRNQYAYKMEGLDEDWIYIGNRTAFDYTNLPSGNYTLLIKGTNSDGVWNESGFSLQILISPPWWLSLPAYVLYIFLFLLCLFLIMKNISDRKEKRNQRLAKMLEESIKVLSRIGEIKDVYTAGHQKRVQKLSSAIAKELKLSEEQNYYIYWGSLIHDIGKIMIPADYLNKPGRLTDLERQILSSHVVRGMEIIQDIDFPIEVISVVAQHHERIDGSGYPNQLKGDEILIESRIVAVADVVEAMSSDRPYRAALGIEVALEEIMKFKGTRYDPAVVDACVRLFRQKDFNFN